MEYSKLEVYAKRMLELAAGNHEFGPKRLSAEKDRLVNDMYRLLRASINKMVGSRSIRNFPSEIMQHSMIAIHQALADWNPSIATFSTHVHWRIRAELATLNHAMFPERRKIKVKQPVQILELDRPYRQDEEGSTSLLDFMVHETAEDDVESEARHHMTLHAIERVFSHHIAQQMTSFCASYTALDKIADRRFNLMRDREIYLRRHLQLHKYDEIAKDIGVTRERVRQIIAKTIKDLRGAMPRLSDERDAAKRRVLEPTRPTPTEIHPDWLLYAAEYHAKTGIDPRLVCRDVPLPEWVEETVAVEGDHVVVEHIETAGMLVAPSVEIVDRIEAEPAPRHQMALDLSREDEDRDADSAPRLGVIHIRHAIVGAMALAALPLPVAAQTSRAVPPDAAPVIIDGQAISPVSHPHARIAARAAGSHADHVGPLEPIDTIVTSRPAWGVRVAEYPSVDAAKAGWASDRRSWDMLKGLIPAYVAPVGDIRTHGVAFGPLTREQAFGLCHEAKRVNRPCRLVAFGKVAAPKPVIKDVSRKGHAHTHSTSA